MKSKPTRNVVIWIVLGLILCFVLFSFLFRFIILGVFIHVDRWKYNVEDFEIYQSDFQTVADFCSDYVKEKESGSYVFLRVSVDGQLYHAGNMVPVDDTIQKCLKQIKKAFPHKDAQLDVIRCYDDMVLFCTHNGQYSVVFSPTSKPTFVNSPDVSKAKSRKITDNWYHVVDK